jgi:hypothetical protein
MRLNGATIPDAIVERVLVRRRRSPENSAASRGISKGPLEPANRASSIKPNQILAARIPRSAEQRNLSA